MRLAAPASTLGVMVSIGAGLYAGALFLAAGLLMVALALVSVGDVRRSCARWYVRHAARKLRDQRRSQREARVEEIAGGRENLAELTALADEIERRDASMFQRYQIDVLLDRHVELVVAHDRCLRAMRMADREQLSRALREFRERPGASPRRADMFERRLRGWDQCKAVADRYDEELALLGETIRLLAQQATCPHGDADAEEPLVLVLAELDEDNAAMRQVGLLGHG